MTGFRFNEKQLSQIPALQLLINLGYEYLPPEKALAQRQGKTGNVLLEGWGGGAAALRGAAG